MFNNNGPIVPQMPDKTKGTYAETRAEIEARKRAQMAADAAMLAAREQPAPKKSPWLTILTIIFAVIAIGAAGFAVYEHTEGDKLKSELTKANTSVNSSIEEIETLKEQNSALKTENEKLKQEILELKPENDTKTSDDSKTGTDTQKSTDQKTASDAKSE